MIKKRGLSREAVLKEMLRLVTSPVNDAVRLAYLSEEQQGEIAGLNLLGLTQFKRNSNGTVELTFADRMGGLEALMDRLEEEREDRATAFFRALETISPDTATVGGDALTEGVSRR
ncbi:MAG: family transcriptional regulator [Firmicutes bacterium]|nr:family transcriptional regulator [Bacillota bacterium]